MQIYLILIKYGDICRSVIVTFLWATYLAYMTTILTKGLISQYYAISWTLEKTNKFYKFKLKHYEETSMFIIEETNSKNNFIQWNIFLLMIVLMITVIMICLHLIYL